MRVWIAVLSLAVVVGGAVGCVSTGSVKEKTPISANLGSYKTASVEVDLPSDMKNADSAKTQFESELGDKLRKKKIFAAVAPGGGEIMVRVRVTKVDGGSKEMQATGALGNAGAAEVKANVELIDTKQDKVVGEFSVTGNSKSNVRTLGQDISDGEVVALSAAGDQIAAYLDDHRGGK